MNINEYAKKNFNNISEINNDLDNIKKVVPILNYSDNESFFVCLKCTKTYNIECKNNNLEEITMKCPCKEKKNI